MRFKIITVERWIGSQLTGADVSAFFDEQHPYMAFDGDGWNALKLKLPDEVDAAARLMKDTRKGNNDAIGNYLSSRARDEIKKHAPQIDVRYMR